MESSDVHKSMTADQITAAEKRKVGKSYVAPGLKPLSPAAAKDLLLQHADAGDPEVQQIIDCVDELEERKVHEAPPRDVPSPKRLCRRWPALMDERVRSGE